MVKHQTDAYKWSFVFMGGGDIESQKDQGQSLGVSRSNTYGYSANAGGTHNLYASISKGITRRRSAQAAGLDICCQAAILTDDEVKNLVTDK
jgi:hypothetical protein